VKCAPNIHFLEVRNICRRNTMPILNENYLASKPRRMTKTWQVSLTTWPWLVTFDLQSVLQVPETDVSPLYYSRKFCMFNLTIYDMKPPNNGYCYCWMETEGKRGSNEVGTCLYRWLSSLPTTVEEAVLYSDKCGSQNRNQFSAKPNKNTNYI